uniref:Uncharacterized protein n=1 Tax=Arion vulgaris TaxID=1028688 RepID=A0A0B7B8A2_9EUPU
MREKNMKEKSTGKDITHKVKKLLLITLTSTGELNCLFPTISQLSAEQLEQHIDRLQLICDDYDMKINNDKTEVMTVTGEESTNNISIDKW